MGISTHVLDLGSGRPAVGLAVALSRLEATRWDLLAKGETDPDGRVAALLPRQIAPAAGVYRLCFATGLYFAALGTATLYPEVEVRFEVRVGERHYHLPLLLTPHSYTTYRGS